MPLPNFVDNVLLIVCSPEGSKMSRTYSHPLYKCGVYNLVNVSIMLRVLIPSLSMYGICTRYVSIMNLIKRATKPIAVIKNTLKNINSEF
jgi:hypothetical protein